MLTKGVSEKDAGLLFSYVKLMHLIECVRKFFFQLRFIGNNST